MSENVYKKIEVTGASGAGMEDAVRNALARAGETLHDLRWFEVVEARGSIEGSQVREWQVTIKVGFKLEG